jgi:hypothetical protein
MEKNEKPVSVVTVKDTVDGLKKAIDEGHEEYIKEVKSLAADYAVKGIPEQKTASIEQFIEPLRATYFRIYNNSALSLGANVRNQLGALDIFSLRQKIKELKLKENGDKTALTTLKESSKKMIGQKTWKEYKRLELMLNIFTGIETCAYILSFIAIGDNYALSTLWAVIISLLQTTGLKSLVLWMRDGSGAALSKFAKVLIWSGVALVATGLGFLRYASIQSDGDTGFAKSPLAPFVFILISYFLISVLAIYVWHNYPKPEELANMKKAAGLDDEIKVKEAELAECQQQISQLTDDCNTVAQVHTLLIHAAKDLYHRVNNHFLYAVGIFKSTNLIRRTDNISPECFSQSVLPLEMPNYDAWNDDELDTKPITHNL